MKELYLNPEMDVVKFSVEDVITTSTTETTWQGQGGENELPPVWGFFDDQV